MDGKKQQRSWLETGRYPITKGYNDRMKPCPDCEGLVCPTTDADFGRCDSCKQEFYWDDLLPTPTPFQIPA